MASPGLTTRPRAPALGIGSFALRYAVGTPGFHPPWPMSASGFLEAAAALGLTRAQLCENLGYADLDDDALRALGQEASGLDLTLELGMKGLTSESLSRHLWIARLTGSWFLRIVLGQGKVHREDDPHRLAAESADILRQAAGEIGALGLTVGIENHFDLPTELLVDLVDGLQDPRVGLVFDTTNSIGFVQTPGETLEAMGGRVVSVHIKDYLIHKVEAGYLMRGAVLGEGWLGLERLLGRLRELAPAAPIIVEMTIRRDESAEAGDVVRWERDAIERSVANLRRALEGSA